MTSNVFPIVNLTFTGYFEIWKLISHNNVYLLRSIRSHNTAQKKIFSIKAIFSKCDQVRRKLRISLMKSLMKKLRKPLMKIFFVPCNSKMKSLKTKFKDL